MMNFTDLYQELVNSTEIIRALTADISQAEARSKPRAQIENITRPYGSSMPGVGKSRPKSRQEADEKKVSAF